MSQATFNLLANPRATLLTRLRDGLPPLKVTAIVTTADRITDGITERETSLQVELLADVRNRDMFEWNGNRYVTFNEVRSPHSNSKKFVLREAAEVATLVTNAG